MIQRLQDQAQGLYCMREYKESPWFHTLGLAFLDIITDQLQPLFSGFYKEPENTKGAC